MNADELRAIPLFADASDAALQRIAAAAGEMTCEAGQILALQGDAGSGMFLILDGTAWSSGAEEPPSSGPGTSSASSRCLRPAEPATRVCEPLSEMRCLALGRDDASN